MNIPQKMLITVIISFLPVISFAEPFIPVLKHPIELQRTYNSPLNKVFDSIQQVAELYKGEIIVNDKTAGLVVFNIRDNTSMNVYLKSANAPDITMVFLKAKFKSGYYFDGIEKDFFDKLEKCLKMAEK